MATLSICLICKNEESCIGEALQSIDSVADEIIVVDTGSTDGTLQIAKNFTNCIYTYPWCDDFSKARNFALQQATMEWVLVIDCDEILEPIAKESIQFYLSKQEVEAYCVNMKLIEDEGEGECLWMCRLFRNNPTYRYKNRLHEQVVQCIEPSHIRPSDITISHKGYTSEQLIQKDKRQRNMHILQSYTEEEKDCFYFYCVGNMCLANSNYKGAVNMYLEALAHFDDPYGFTESLVVNLCESFYLLKDYEQVLRLNQAFHMILLKSPKGRKRVEEARRELANGIYTSL